MKKIFFSVILLAIFSCNSHPKTTYEITDWRASVPTNTLTFDCAEGWVKMVVYKDSIVKSWKLNSNGDTVWTEKNESDTFYYLKTADPQLPLRDSAGHPKLDKATGQQFYYLSWRNPTPIPKDVVDPRKQIPFRFLPQMNNAIPQPLKDSVKKPDSARLNVPVYNKKVVK